MKKVFLVGLTIFFLSCGQKHLFSLNISDENVVANTKLDVQLENYKNKKIDSVLYYFQGNKMVSTVQESISLKGAKLGKHLLKAVVYFENQSTHLSKNIMIFADVSPKIYDYTILAEYPHDIKAYTQGLEFYNGKLYESTGLYGKSSLREVDYKTGEVLRKIDLNKAYFGEGITVMDNKIYQLTWKSKVGFIYDMNFKKQDVFIFNKSREGWGICNDGTRLYKSDGSDKIWLLDPKTLLEKDYLQICSNKSLYSKANELEWANGKIYANTYLKDGIMIINPKNGAVIGVVDCRGLKERVTQHKNLDVLNGIAYNPDTKSFFITGKNWDKLFEISIVEKK